jgi:5-methylthioadenosine/S-adenosylhomocysteine deaminase
MKTSSGLTRRDFLGGTVVAGAIGVAGCARKSSGLPARGEFVIRNAYVMTMDPTLGDVSGGDIHVKNGEIVAVGQGLQAGAAEVIDGNGMIVLPGLVDTHWHMWNTLLRSMAGDTAELGYFAVSPGIGKFYMPGDTYQGVRLAAAEAINAGITFVHDWSHNIRGPEFAEEDLRALRESGIRGRFSYGTAQGQPATETVNLADVIRLQGDWTRYSNEGLLSLGLAWRGGTSEVGRKEFDAARGLGIPLSAHSGIRANVGQVVAMAQAGLLGKDVQLIHATSVTPEEIAAIAAADSPVSLSPFTELRTGFGFPPTSEFMDAKVRVGLSVDTTGLSGNADMFSIMKLIQNVENGRALSEFKLPARKVLELGTIGGARSMGVDHLIGSLTPGKRADLIMVTTRDINMAVFSDPAYLMVDAAEPSNVDTVVVDGRILKRGRKLTAVDTEQVVSEAGAAFAAVRKRANWP